MTGSTAAVAAVSNREPWPQPALRCAVRGGQDEEGGSIGHGRRRAHSVEVFDPVDDRVGSQRNRILPVRAQIREGRRERSQGLARGVWSDVLVGGQARASIGARQWDQAPVEGPTRPCCRRRGSPGRSRVARACDRRVAQRSPRSHVDEPTRGSSPGRQWPPSLVNCARDRLDATRDGDRVCRLRQRHPDDVDTDANPTIIAASSPTGSGRRCEPCWACSPTGQRRRRRLDAGRVQPGATGRAARCTMGLCCRCASPAVALPRAHIIGDDDFAFLSP